MFDKKLTTPPTVHQQRMTLFPVKSVFPLKARCDCKPKLYVGTEEQFMTGDGWVLVK